MYVPLYRLRIKTHVLTSYHALHYRLLYRATNTLAITLLSVTTDLQWPIAGTCVGTVNLESVYFPFLHGWGCSHDRLRNQTMADQLFQVGNLFSFQINAISIPLPETCIPNSIHHSHEGLFTLNKNESD